MRDARIGQHPLDVRLHHTNHDPQNHRGGGHHPEDDRPVVSERLERGEKDPDERSECRGFHAGR